MSKRELPSVYYDLIPSQNCMYYMFKLSLHKNVMQIPTCMTSDRAMNIDLLKKAVNIEIERNDCMRIRFFTVDKVTKQTFMPSLHLDDIPVKNFNTQKEMDDYLTADAKKPVHADKGETFRIVLFNNPEGHTGVYFNVSHAIMDALAVAVFYGDLFAVYTALETGSAMPEPLYSFEDAVKNDLAYLQDQARYEKDKKFYMEYWANNGMPFYAGVHGPELLLQQRKKTNNPNLTVPSAYDPLHDKCDIVCHHVPPEQAKVIFNFCLETKNAPENIILLGMRTHCSAINYRTPDTLQLPLCSRRVTYKTKRMGGCLAQPLQLHTVISEDKTFTEALQIMFGTRTQLYRHSNFPYMHARVMQMKAFNFKNSQGPSCMMFTWLPLYVPEQNGLHFDFKTLNPGRYVMPLYIFAAPSMKDGGLDLYYLYRTSFITPDQILALHKSCIKVMLEGIENPDLTIGELMDSIS